MSRMVDVKSATVKPQQMPQGKSPPKKAEFTFFEQDYTNKIITVKMDLGGEQGLKQNKCLKSKRQNYGTKWYIHPKDWKKAMKSEYKNKYDDIKNLKSNFKKYKGDPKSRKGKTYEFIKQLDNKTLSGSQSDSLANMEVAIENVMHNQ